MPHADTAHRIIQAAVTNVTPLSRSFDREIAGGAVPHIHDPHRPRRFLWGPIRASRAMGPAPASIHPPTSAPVALPKTSSTGHRLHSANSSIYSSTTLPVRTGPRTQLNDPKRLRSAPSGVVPSRLF